MCVFLGGHSETPGLGLSGGYSETLELGLSVKFHFGGGVF